MSDLTTDQTTSIDPAFAESTATTTTTTEEPATLDSTPTQEVGESPNQHSNAVSDVDGAGSKEDSAPMTETANYADIENDDNIPVATTNTANGGERTRKHIETTASDNESDDDLRKMSAPHLPKSASLDVTENLNDNAFEDPHRKRRELEDKLDRILKKPKVRRTRRDEDDLEQYLDEKILRLKDEMNIAAQMDIDTLNKRIETGNTSLIAMQKVKLLPKVSSVLSKANLADTILDNNLLQSVRIWLEPLPDGSLPAFEIQKSLFAALNDLPIKTEHLKESGLGRVVIFYTKSKRVEPQLAKLAEKLIAEWTRPVIGASDNYRDKRIMELEFDSEKLRKKSALGSAKSRRKRPSETSGGSTAQTLYEQAAARRNRAAAPAQTTTDYKYAPVNHLASVSSTARTTGVGSTLNNSEMYKRLASRLNKHKRAK
ncbi:hypothetical protein NCAS_0A11710 [Naumovozyma castellii]|uniref:TFIIS N-terminal domain-containing protein n=1 Tax=Naumovozyma castellii TaxID=27288 RepID=G0V8D1_NAUCA|nr:hypothetical protein NCAS_0A11710 [Naumovozyma castellii CBS 4309]CCC67729.1 hypothetical protein NCAS_0A11710 [Naumovozyma castellii CBS 4309]